MHTLIKGSILSETFGGHRALFRALQSVTFNIILKHKQIHSLSLLTCL
jgi:hypothetical protein